MRYAIMADVHGNLEALDAVLAALGPEQIDAYLCVGDVVGYGPNPRECLARLRKLKTIFVAGNHDWAAAEKHNIESFNPWARAAILWTREQLTAPEKNFLSKLPLKYQNEDLVMVHGTLHEPEEFHYMDSLLDAAMTFLLLDRQVCFVGHNHVPAIIVHQADQKVAYSVGYSAQWLPGKQFIINVGSVGQPRDGRPEAAFCIYDSGAGLAEIKRVSYPVSATQQKMQAVGLPVQLSNRLALGF